MTTPIAWVYRTSNIRVLKELYLRLSSLGYTSFPTGDPITWWPGASEFSTLLHKRHKATTVFYPGRMVVMWYGNLSFTNDFVDRHSRERCPIVYQFRTIRTQAMLWGIIHFL